MIKSTSSMRLESARGVSMGRKYVRTTEIARRIFAVLAVSALLPLLSSCVASRASASGPPTIKSFTVSPGTTIPGTGVVLSWVVDGAAKIALNDGTSSSVTAVPVSGSSVQVAPMATTTYTLIATGGDGSTVSSIVTNASTGATVPAAVTVTVVPAPVISSFTSTASSIATGQSATLSWSVANVATLTLGSVDTVSHLVGNLDVTGTTSLEVNPSDTTIYTLYASTAAPLVPAATAQLQVTVQYVAKPVFNSPLSASSVNIVTGGSTTLSWSVSNATQLSLIAVDANHPSGVTTDVTGQTSYTANNLQLSTQYTLVAANSAGVTTPSNTVAVKVSSCPPPQIVSFAADPVSLGPGSPVSLTAVFNGGIAGDLGVATIDNGIGTVTTGVPIPTATLNASTTFHLTVTSACGATNTAALRVPVGSVALYAGQSLGGQQDGLATAARFAGPIGLAADSSGNLYVADSGGYTIRMIDPSGNVSTIAGVAFMPGSVDGPLGTGLLNNAQGVAVDASGNVYVSDTGNNTIRMIAAGTHVMTTLAGNASNGAGYKDGTGPAAQFNGPTGLSVSAQGTVYVADKSNNNIRAITPAGVVTTLAGSDHTDISNADGAGYADGTGTAALFDQPSGIVLSSDGNLYVADGANYVVRELTTAGVVTTIAGQPKTSGSADGVASAAAFGTLRAIVGDNAGALYVADSTNRTIRRLTPINNGFTVDTVAGTAGLSNMAPSGPLPAQLNDFQGLALNLTTGNFYFTATSQNIVYSVTY